MKAAETARRRFFERCRKSGTTFCSDFFFSTRDNSAVLYSSTVQSIQYGTQDNLLQRTKYHFVDGVAIQLLHTQPGSSVYTTALYRVPCICHKSASSRKLRKSTPTTRPRRASSVSFGFSFGSAKINRDQRSTLLCTLNFGFSSKTEYDWLSAVAGSHLRQVRSLGCCELNRRQCATTKVCVRSYGVSCRPGALWR